ncbi:MAG: aldolase/citrate lyase family protein, partial [Bacteroidales bacterium]
EIMSMAGFDWVMIDMEHSTLSLDAVQKHIQALRPGVTSIVRVPTNDDTWIKRVLDTGCDGIMVPMVKTRQEAERAVKSLLYPPDGSRSVGISRAHRYGIDFTGYVFGRSHDLKILVQIEHIEGVNNLDDILSVKGISGIFIGPYDLSASMRMMGKVTSPEVRAEIAKIKSKCAGAGIPWGIFGMTPDAVRQEISDGGEWILCGIDSVILSTSARTIAKSLGE